MTTLIRILVIALVAASILSIGCRNEKSKNEGQTIKADKRVEMITKAEGEQKPFFRAVLKFKNPDGNDAENIRLHNNQELKKAIKIKTSAKKTVNPFYVHTSAQEGAGGAGNEVSHDILLLFDVSGSMNYKDIPPDRFTAAKVAAVDLVNGLPANYRVAVAPFESHRVKDKIDDAKFLPPRDAAKEIQNLPKPDDNGNTALYSAIDLAIDVLKKRKDDGESQDQSLIVLTDGKNDVGHAGDDPKLLDDKGYQTVLAKLKEYNTRTFTIGLGRPNKGEGNDKAFEEEKLKQLASTQGETRYFQADNIEQLKANFAAVQKSVKNTVLITFCTDDKNLHDLRSLRFEINYISPDGNVFKGVIPWVCRNSITGCVPSPSGTLNSQEYAALEGSDCDKDMLGPWQQILGLLGRLALFSGGIAVLWIFLPHRIWPAIPLPQLFSRGKKKSALPTDLRSQPSSSSSSSSLDRATPSKPRQRFEETRIYDKPGRRDDPRGRQ